MRYDQTTTSSNIKKQTKAIKFKLVTTQRNAVILGIKYFNHYTAQHVLSLLSYTRERVLSLLAPEFESGVGVDVLNSVNAGV